MAWAERFGSLGEGQSEVQWLKPGLGDQSWLLQALSGYQLGISKPCPGICFQPTHQGFTGKGKVHHLKGTGERDHSKGVLFSKLQTTRSCTREANKPNPVL